MQTFVYFHTQSPAGKAARPDKLPGLLKFRILSNHLSGRNVMYDIVIITNHHAFIPQRFLLQHSLLCNGQTAI